MLAATAKALAQTAQKMSEENPYDFFSHFGLKSEKEQKDVIFELIKAITYGIVEERSKAGHLNVLLEPFASVPAKFQTEEVLHFVKSSVFEDLQKQGYRDIDWEIKDGRVLLSFGW